MATSDTTFGQDMDTFIATYIPENKKELAMAELQLIVLKATKQTVIEMRNFQFPKQMRSSPIAI